MTGSPATRALRPALYGAPIGVLGGLIGLGGAEFRLPVLRAAFGFDAKRAVALNLAVSLVTLLVAVCARAPSTDFAALRSVTPIMAAMIFGSLVGARIGTAYASRVSLARLELLVLVLLVGIGIVLIAEGFLPLRTTTGLPTSLSLRIPVGAAAGLGIGVVSSLLGVAGGELIIPTLVLAFGVEMKLAGTASTLISLPAVMLGTWRYARHARLITVDDMKLLVVPMGIGSAIGVVAGGLLLPFVPSGPLKLVLGAILIVSAIRIYRHGKQVAALKETAS